VAWLEAKHFDKERTREGYEPLLSSQVPGWLKGTAVGKITNPMLEEWVKDRVSAGVRPGTVRNAMRNVIKPALDYAVATGLVRSNPALGVSCLGWSRKKNASSRRKRSSYRRANSEGMNSWSGSPPTPGSGQATNGG
jgi:hypothetical protein